MAQQDDEIRALNFSWLVKLRWAAIAAQLLLLGFSESLLNVRLPALRLAAVIGLEALSNLACLAWQRRTRRIPEWGLAAPIALDLVLLTWMLAVTGGASNPFTVLYLVGVALAGVVFQSRWTWALVVLALLCFGALYIAAEPIPWDRHISSLLLPYANPLRVHLKGMWLAFGVAAALIVHFVHREMRILARREKQLEEKRQAAARREKLASLAALAAGAAHELGTPLSTIALVAKELERQLERGAWSADAVADARLIREQVERCRHILWQMAADAGQSAGETMESLALSDLVERALAEVSGRERVTVKLAPGTEAERLAAPPRALAHALKGLVKNALQASPPEAGVSLQVVLDGQHWRLTVKDAGHGMTPEVLAHAGEPFFTTKEPGRGMGLGLFLTRALMEQLGGQFELESKPGAGTTATLVLPRSAGGALAA